MIQASLRAELGVEKKHLCNETWPEFLAYVTPFGKESGLALI